jgi:hypothetical protein
MKRTWTIIAVRDLAGTIDPIVLVGGAGIVAGVSLSAGFVRDIRADETVLRRARGVTGRSKRQLAWLGLVGSALAASFCWAGVAMNASFAAAVADSHEQRGHIIAVYIFLGGLVLSIAIMIGSAVFLLRQRHASRGVV